MMYANELVQAFRLNYLQSSNTDGNIEEFIERAVEGKSHPLEIKAYETGLVMMRMLDKNCSQEKIVKYLENSITAPYAHITSYLLAMF